MQDEQNQQEILTQILNRQIAQEKKLDDIAKKLRSKRWNKIWTWTKRIFFILVFIFIIKALAEGINPKRDVITKPHIAKIDIYGGISASSTANSNWIISSIKEAIDEPKVKSIILDINSPGGSPVQAAQIYTAIMQYKTKKPIYTVISDLGASGAYYIASAGTEVLAHKSSLVGSIGVISMNFGVKDLMKKIGVEPRIITAGENKAFLSDFTDMTPEQKRHWQNILNQTHQDFIADVKRARGDKIIREKKVFSGLIFSAKDAKNYGLIDDFGSIYSLKEKYKLPMVNYTYQPDFWEELEGFSIKFSQKLFSNLTTPKLQ